MKPFSVITLFSFLFPFIANCQDIYTLSGRVTGADRQPVAAGEAYILNEGDSATVSKTFINNGDFIFEPVKKGEYFLKITSMGFKDKIQVLILDESKNVTVALEPSVSVLKEVTITGSKKTYINANGNMLVNVAGSPLASVPDAVSLLSRLPAVQVSPDGETISMVGRGQPLIYIDNQKMNINDLKSLSVSDIKTIELISNPSAKYEAEGRSVILITRKANKKQGWKAEFAETAAYRRYYLNRSSASLSVRKKRLELRANLQYNQLKTWEGNAFDFRINGPGIRSTYSVTAVTTRPQFIGEAGMFYQINENDYLSFSSNARTQQESFPIYTHSYLKDASREENVFTSSFNKNPNLYYTSKLNYNRKIKNGLLFIGAQHTGYYTDLMSTIFNSYDDALAELSQNRQQKTTIRVLAGRVDFEKTFAKEMKWELGGSATHAGSNGFSDIHNSDPANRLNAVFNYDEKNFAAYTQLSGKFKKMNYSTGLRIENNDVVSDYDDNNSSSSAIKRKSVQLFPKASMTILVDSSKNITLKYSKSITRPDYSNANQTAVYVNPYFEWANNINLEPSVTQEIGATFQYGDYSLAMSIYQTRGPVYANFNYDTRQTILRRTETNYDRERGAQMALTLPFKYGIWSSTNVINAVLRSARDSAATVGKSRPFIYCYSSNEFKLPGEFTFTVSGWAVTKSYQGVYERNALFAVDTSLTKTISKKLNCSVRFNDIFRSVNGEEKFSINDIAANGVFYDNAREFAVAIKYSIGKLTDTRFKNKDIDESGNRIR